MTKTCRGSSLQTVMALVALMSVLAAGMVGVYTSSLNHVQGFSNREMAQAEADSAITELIARLNADPNFGNSGEEIRGTRTTRLTPEQAYHVLTFTGSGGFPESTNARGGSRSGSLGRTVPNGHVHAVATGYCRGQYRTVEALIEHPPFPYGLASSGRIQSSTPLVIKGTSGAWIPGREDRPGHLVSNSPLGVSIGSEAGAATHISGFVKSVGGISIDQPATVLEGIFPNDRPVVLPDINLEEFSNVGNPGVIEILDSEFPAQILDVMYHSEHTITYNGPVQMNNSFLFCRGDVNIYGGLTGIGAIVALGDINVNGASALDGTNNVALLAGGTVRLRGGGNFFRGIVYGKSGIDARSITVVGNAIANNPGAPESATVRLEDVIFISSHETSVLNFVARSNRRATRQVEGGGRIPFQIDPFDGGGEFPRGDRGSELIGATDARGSLDEIRSGVRTALAGLWTSDGPSDITWSGGYSPSTQGGAVRTIGELFQTAFGYLERGQEIALEIEALRTEQGTADDDRSAEIDTEIASLETEMASAKGEFDAAIAAAEAAYMDYVQETAASNGSYIDDGFLEVDIEVPYTIDLNTYIPPAESYRVGFYTVHGHRK